MMAKPRRTRSATEPTSGSKSPGFLDYARTLGYLGPLQFIEDLKGRRTAVVVSTAAFERLLEDHWAMSSALSVKDEDLVDWEEAKAELQRDGILPS